MLNCIIHIKIEQLLDYTFFSLGFPELSVVALDEKGNHVIGRAERRRRGWLLKDVVSSKA